MTNKNVVAIGVFDGVHAGHKYLINAAKKIALNNEAKLVVASFHPHPVSVLRPESFLGLITGPDFRTELLKSAGANRVEFIDFTKTVSQMSPDEFVEVVVLGQLKANIVVIGQNFRFGAKASGNVETLQTLGNKFGFEVEVIELAGDSNTWSSTRIRTHLINGEVDLASQLLGRPHRLVGEVVHGDHRGRELGYPTANMAVQDNVIIPADGVYSALMTAIEPVTNDKRIFPAAVSIGTNPTFEDVMERRVEAYAIGQENLDLYGQVITLDFIKAVRPMEKFAGITELLAAMASDISKATIQINDFLDSPSH